MELVAARAAVELVVAATAVELVVAVEPAQDVVAARPKILSLPGVPLSVSPALPPLIFAMFAPLFRATIRPDCYASAEDRRLPDDDPDRPVP
jgi:hypothetical protein